ncbi:MAG: hypothetical protein PHG63_02160 [Candidatus Dojkabacteria bacterium]|nr:hypothetical protein [Candidatus Dojkabacteria bacterium]
MSAGPIPEVAVGTTMVVVYAEGRQPRVETAVSQERVEDQVVRLRFAIAVR